MGHVCITWSSEARQASFTGTCEEERDGEREREQEREGENWRREKVRERRITCFIPPSHESREPPGSETIDSKRTQSMNVLSASRPILAST